MTGPPALRAGQVRMRAALIVAVLFLSYAYFYQAGGWNQNARFDMTRAILEQRTLSIDAYHQNTQDKALFGGHYYSDKAPGISLLAIPGAATAKSALEAAGIDPNSPQATVAMSYAASLFAVALPTALAAGCLFLVGVRLGAGVSGSAFAALSFGLATPMWAYATVFWGHATAGAFLLFAFLGAVALREPGRPPRDFWLGLGVGLAAGWGTISEYPAAPASFVLALLALALVRKDGRPRVIRVLAGLALGAGLCCAFLMAFQYAAFGSPFRFGYEYDAAYPGMRHSFGLGPPKIDRALKLLFGGRRGLFFHAPILAAVPFGLWWMWKRQGQRTVVAAIAIIAIYYLIFNASFYAWHGGWSYGPRYLAAALPLLCVGLAPLWSYSGPRLRAWLTVLALCSGFFTLTAVATTVQPVEGMKYPLFQLCIPNFFLGNLSLNHGSFLAQEIPGENHGAFNLGELAGLHGLLSLLPLFLIWALGGLIWLRMNRRN